MHKVRFLLKAAKPSEICCLKTKTEGFHAQYLLWPYAGSHLDTAVYFKNTYSDRWITAPLAVEIIRDVDHSKLVGSKIIECPVLDMITPL